MNHTILVVEDNLDILAASCDYLMGLGYRVEGSRDSDDAKRKIQQKHYSIVLSDVRLRNGDDSDGLVLAEFIDQHRHGTPVILLTACGDPDLHLRAMRCGVIKVLNKPQPLAQIASVVRETLFHTYDRFFTQFGLPSGGE